jgi:hypothetical protein
MIHDAGVSLQNIFLTYLVVPAFIIASQLIVFPSASLTFGNVNGKNDTVTDDVSSGSKENLTTDKLGDVEADDDEIIDPDLNDNSSHDSKCDAVSTKKSSLAQKQRRGYTLAGLSLREHLSSREFWLITLYMCIMMLKMNFYMSSVTTRFPDDRSHLVTFFNYALPVGGVISIPLIGLALKHFSVSSALVLVFALNLICSISELLHNFDIPQYIGISLFSVVRPFLYATCSEYCAKIFGFETFGRVYGSVFLFSGLFNLNNYWIKMVVSSSSSTSSSYFMVDLVMAISTFLALLCPYYVSRRVSENR